MSWSVNVPPAAGPVPMIAMFAGIEGTPFASSAHSDTHSVVLAGNDPPVPRMIEPMPGAPAPVALNSFTGSLPVITRVACWLPSCNGTYT